VRHIPGQFRCFPFTTGIAPHRHLNPGDYQGDHGFVVLEALHAGSGWRVFTMSTEMPRCRYHAPLRAQITLHAINTLVGSRGVTTKPCPVRWHNWHETVRSLQRVTQELLTGASLKQV
jgi:hypothetical protein